jgi:hypothetical protein
MNPGIQEEAGQTVRTLVGSLKDSPITLALVLFNLIFILVIYFATRENRAAMDRTMTEMLKQNAHMVDLLAKCSPDKPVEDK